MVKEIMQEQSLKHFVEAALLVSAAPINIDTLHKAAAARPDVAEASKGDLREALKTLVDEYAERGIELVEVASGFRVQINAAMGQELVGLFEERPPRYSRAFFETLALIAYRQPVTRGEIEDVRGVAVSSNIIRSMLEREWVRVVGHRDVPGKPAMFGTTKAFLDYFNLKKLDDLPSLADLTDIESLRIQLDLPTVEDGSNNPPAVALATLAGNVDADEALLTASSLDVSEEETQEMNGDVHNGAPADHDSEADVLSAGDEDVSANEEAAADVVDSDDGDTEEVEDPSEMSAQADDDDDADDINASQASG